MSQVVKSASTAETAIAAAVIAAYAVVDSSGRLGVLGVLTRIGLNVIPGAAAPFFVGVVMCDLAGDAVLTVQIQGPDGGAVLKQAPSARLHAGSTGGDVAFVFEMSGVTFRLPGKHVVHVFLDGALLARLPLTVERRGDSTGNTHAAQGSRTS